MIEMNVLTGRQQGTVFRLKEESFNIGRAMSNQVILYDEKVSSCHAVISTSGGRIVVRDVGSTNGTFVNGKRIHSAEVKSGDKLRMGDTEMILESFEGMEDTTSVRVVQDESGSVTIHETIPSSEGGSTIFNVGDVSIESLQAAHRNLEAMYRVNSVLNSTFDLSRLFERIMDQIFKVMRADRGVLMVVNEDTGELDAKATRSRESEDAKQVILSHTIVNEVLRRGSGILTSDAMSDDRFSSVESVEAFHIRSAMCAPIRSKERTIGIIYVDNKMSSGTFKRSDLELLTALGNEAGIAIDNTKLYEANVRAERLAAMGEALAGLSHYIKNILMCMQGGGQLVQRALDEGNFGAVPKGWNIVRRNEQKLSGLVMDMLSYCKERRPMYERCDLKEIINDVLELSVPLLEEKSIKIECDFDEENIILQADSDSLSRCLLNVFANAIDAVEPDTGKIVITARKDEATGEVAVSVRDNGSGIPADVMPNVFEAFCSTKGSKGTGLGLAVVSKVVKEHGGKIEVESEPREGAVFTVRFPAGPETDDENATEF